MTNKYLDLVWELKRLWNVKMISIGALEMILFSPKAWNKRLEELEVRERIKTIQIPASLRLNDSSEYFSQTAVKDQQLTLVGKNL